MIDGISQGQNISDQCLKVGDYYDEPVESGGPFFRSKEIMTIE